MITTDKETLKKVSNKTTVAECERLDVFSLLQKELEEAKGLGLCAIQIGIPVRACLVKTKEKLVKMINPVITAKHDLNKFIGEKCLSLPGVVVDTLRYQQVTVSWFDVDAYEDKQAVFVEQEAVCVQHELDHMEGKVITDRAAPATVKVGRNDPCPCGSGKKYKKCCLA
jgi:peptide deformylase